MAKTYPWLWYKWLCYSYCWHGKTMDVYTSSMRSTYKLLITMEDSHYFYQKMMQRWKASVCFHSHLSNISFTNVILPISPSLTGFHQCIKIVWLLHICWYHTSSPYLLYEKCIWKKALFSSTMNYTGDDFVFQTWKSLWFFSDCTNLNTDALRQTAFYKILGMMPLATFCCR